MQSLIEFEFHVFGKKKKRAHHRKKSVLTNLKQKRTNYIKCNLEFKQINLITRKKQVIWKKKNKIIGIGIEKTRKGDLLKMKRSLKMKRYCSKHWIFLNDDDHFQGHKNIPMILLHLIYCLDLCKLSSLNCDPIFSHHMVAILHVKSKHPLFV